MKNLKFLTVLMAASVAAGALASAPALAQSDSLIPRKLIFGNPSRLMPKLSPDGKSLAWIAPRDGVLNVWVAPADALPSAKPVTNERPRPITEFWWSPDSTRILYTQDRGGNENWVLYGVEVATGKQTTYTDPEKVTVRLIGASPKVPGSILIGLNNRVPQYHDVYRVDLASGKRDLVLKNDRWAGFAADWDLNLRYGFRQTPAGGAVVDKVSADGKAEPWMEIGADDVFTTEPAGMTADGRTVYLRDSRNRNTSAFFAVDVESGRQTPIGGSEKADVSGLIADPSTGEIQAYGINYLKREWVPVSPAVKDDLALLDRELKGEWSVLSQTRDGRKWTLQVDRVSEPVTFYLYDRDTRKLTRLFTARPDLEGRALAPMGTFEVRSRDGLVLPTYLSLPPGSDRNGDGKPDAPLPTVLYVHGGPWARDDYGYNSVHQWLANRGYAVLSVNYRGSTGFGKSFLNAANREFAGKMHDDLIDVVNWALKEGITQRDKLAIMGGSYGGYATLVGMTFTPETFACGVDIVGPSNLVTLIESFPPYWAPIMELSWYPRVGDPRKEADRKDLLARSPITRVDQIRRPLLIGQGANDPRVTQKESDQIVAAMKAKSIPVTYALYPDEGHGFARPENRTSFFAITEGFLAKCLGGRQEPIGSDFTGSSLRVPEGTDYVPGLKEAAAGRN
ncbi:MAG TPA: S9 family peptidase [Burkholderiaceae bacterium]|nr:S9 family peptidase [Burkholderiaceae bacterium]